MIKTYFVDSFTDVPFKGNPAAICLPTAEISEEKMQAIAHEIGFSETAFVSPAEVPNEYLIRYFSPKKEIPLCGHATLAAARIIFNQPDINSITFINKDKIRLPVSLINEEIKMEFPVYLLSAHPEVPAILQALGLKQVLTTLYSEKNKIILLEIAEADLLALITPDFKALTDAHQNINGVLVTSKSNSEAYDFQYRYFWPWAGTNEDPVTGGVQTFLTKFWYEKLGKTCMKAFQCSQRTGSMTVEYSENKVSIYGKAVIVLSGECCY